MIKNVYISKKLQVGSQDLKIQTALNIAFVLSYAMLQASGDTNVEKGNKSALVASQKPISVYLYQ